MTHTHKTKIPIILITTALTLAALTGCQNIFNRTPEPAVKYGKITVTVDLGETPQNARSTQDDRSAMPSTFEGTEYVFAGAVHDSSTTVTKDMLEIAEFAILSDTKEELTVGIPFVVSTDDRNDYTLSIYVFKSGTTSISDSDFASPIFYGTTTVTIPANAITSSAVDSVKLVPKTIPNDINGKIGLKIEVPKNHTLSAECNTSGHSASSCGFDFTQDTELSDASTTSDFYTFTESDTSTGIASGEHDVTFTVQKPMGTSPETYTPVYLWTEAITVYPYLTTGRWINGLDEPTDTRVITESQFYSTFYVSGTSPGLLTVAGNDTDGDGSLAKPFATVQKAVDKVIAMNNGAADESYAIYVDGTITATGGSGRVANISTTKNLTLSIIGLGTTKTTLNANLGAATANGNVMAVSGSGLHLTLQNLKLIGGKNSSNGGGIYIGGGEVTITDCEISGNSSGNGGGGGIFINGGTTKLTNCTISGNSTSSSEGGGIYNSNGATEFTNCTISKNSANYSGGGIYNNSGTITLTDCTISENAASRYQGGGILNKRSLTINSGSISKNTAKQHGGGIYNEGTLIINSGEISGNKVTESNNNGGGIYNAGTLTINSGIINGNSAPKNGGGIYIGNGTATITGGTISGNTTTVVDKGGGGNGGGGIFINGGTLTITDCKITGNKAESAYGGAILAANGVSVEIGGSSCIGDSSATTAATASSYSNFAYNGGAIAIFGASESNITSFTLKDNASIKYNYASFDPSALADHPGGGGAVFFEDYGKFVLGTGTDSPEISCNASAYGGGLSIYGANNIFEMKSGWISNNNAATHNGGGIYCNNGATMTITGGTISGNTAAGTGKAIYNNGTLEMSGSVQVAENNEIYLISGKYITIAGNLSKDNVSRILLPSASYANDTKVLAAKDTTVSITKGACDKFTLLDDTASETSIDFTIRPNSDGTQGVIKKISMTGTAELPTDKMNFSLLVKPNGMTSTIPYNSSYAARAGDKLSFSVENANGDAIPSDATYKIAMMKNGVELVGYTQTSTGSTPEIEVPEKFANTNMTLDIYMSATVTVNGVTTTFDDTVSVKTVKEVVVTAADFSAYFDALVSAKVPDIYVTVDVSNETELKSVADKIKGISTDSNINSVDLKISGSITSMSTNTFEACKKLVSVTILSSITKIANWGFQNCTALKYVYIPNSVKELGNGVFNGCSSLEEITIPPSVEGLGCSIFGGCTSLKTITFTNETGFSDVFGVAFEGVPATCVAKVPNSLLAHYEEELRKSYVGFHGTIVGY